MVDHVRSRLLMSGAGHMTNDTKCNVAQREERSKPLRGHVGNGASWRLMVMACVA